MVGLTADTKTNAKGQLEMMYANRNNLREAVETLLIDEMEGLNADERESWLDDLEQHGCVSGMVSSLIYHTDTTSFFDEHEEEILDLAKQYEFTADPVKEGMTGFKNTMAWFAFEVLARDVYENAHSIDWDEENAA